MVLLLIVCCMLGDQDRAGFEGMVLLLIVCCMLGDQDRACS